MISHIQHHPQTPSANIFLAICSSFRPKMFVLSRLKDALESPIHTFRQIVTKSGEAVPYLVSPLCDTLPPSIFLKGTQRTLKHDQCCPPKQELGRHRTYTLAQC